MRTGCDAVGKRSVDGVGEQVDEHLLELIGIGVQRCRRARVELDGHALFKQRDALKQRRNAGPA